MQGAYEGRVRNNVFDFGPPGERVTLAGEDVQQIRIIGEQEGSLGLSNRVDKYARKGSTERSGVGETASGKTAEEWG